LPRTLARKKRLAKAHKHSKAVPTWIILKTQGKVRTHSKRRNWRRGRIKP